MIIIKKLIITLKLTNHGSLIISTDSTPIPNVGDITSIENNLTEEDYEKTKDFINEQIKKFYVKK